MTFTEQNSNTPAGSSVAWRAAPFEDIAAAATLDLNYAGFANLSGTATIGEFDNFETGRVYVLKFDTGASISIDDTGSATIGYAASGVRHVGAVAIFVESGGLLYEIGENDATKLNLTGGTMSGALTISADLNVTGTINISSTGPALVLSETDTSQSVKLTLSGGAVRFFSQETGNTYVYFDNTAPSSSLRLESTGYLRIGSSAGPLLCTGSGTPEAVVSAPIGSLYMDTAGGASTTLYVKESGTGTTGWVAK